MLTVDSISDHDSETYIHHNVLYFHIQFIHIAYADGSDMTDYGVNELFSVSVHD